ncbi:MAG TPA: hypothetical protein VM029_11730 [Opitutaceae bacterium]|nr:hypothetical protein [Opitutaceae bacterium]
MSADDNESDAGSEEKKSYSFLWRFIVFLFIAGPASVVGFGLYGRVGIQHALNAAERGDYSQSLIFLLWFGGLIGTAIMVFKK